MATLRNFSYDHPMYRMVHQWDAGQIDMTSSTAVYAKFRSRMAVVITAVTAYVASASSAAKVIFTMTRGGSANTTFTIAQASTALSAGNMTVAPVAITLLSAGDQLGIKTSEPTGEYHILYEYQILPSESLYARA